MDTHSLSQGTQHIFYTAVLPNICFHSSERGGRAGRTVGLPTLEKKFHKPNWKNWESFDAGWPATHRNHTHSLPDESVHKLPPNHNFVDPRFLFPRVKKHAYVMVKRPHLSECQCTSIISFYLWWMGLESDSWDLHSWERCSGEEFHLMITIATQLH